MLFKIHPLTFGLAYAGAKETMSWSLCLLVFLARACVVKAADNEQIPMQVLQDVSTAGNLTEFLEHFFKPETLLQIPVAKDEDKQVMLRSSNVRSDRLFPTAKCEPHLEIVELEKSRDPLTIYWPSCTRIERCSGCCIHELLACTPTEIENVTMKVIKARYSDPQAKKFEYTDRKSVTLERHLACECKCRVQASDCKPWQNYRASQCRCVCANENEASSCVGENKFWDNQKCSCVCRNVSQCSTGTFFDPETCKCITSEGGKVEETFIPLPDGPAPPPRFRGIYKPASKQQQQQQPSPTNATS